MHTLRPCTLIADMHSYCCHAPVMLPCSLNFATGPHYYMHSHCCRALELLTYSLWPYILMRPGSHSQFTRAAVYSCRGALNAQAQSLCSAFPPQCSSLHGTIALWHVRHCALMTWSSSSHMHSFIYCVLILLLSNPFARVLSYYCTATITLILMLQPVLLLCTRYHCALLPAVHSFYRTLFAAVHSLL